MRDVDEFLDTVTDSMSALVAEVDRLRKGAPAPMVGLPTWPTSHGKRTRSSSGLAPRRPGSSLKRRWQERRKRRCPRTAQP